MGTVAKIQADLLQLEAQLRSANEQYDRAWAEWMEANTDAGLAWLRSMSSRVVSLAGDVAVMRMALRVEVDARAMEDARAGGVH